MENTNKKNHIGNIIFFLVCIALGGLLGGSLSMEFGDTLSWWQVILRVIEGVLLFLLAFFFQVVLHEAGHMVAALIRGWSFISFMVLGVVLTRRDGKFHLSRFAVLGVGGQCLMMPPSEGETDFGIAFYNAGGILMNIIISLATLVLLIVCGDSFVWEMVIFLASLSITGFLFVLINGIPSESSGLPNDGMNIRGLKKDAFSTHVFLMTMRGIGKLQQGDSIDEVSEEFLDNRYLCEGVAVDYKNPIHIGAIAFDLSLAIARFDFEKAHSILDQLDVVFDTIVPIYQKEISYERVFLYLVSPREGVDVWNLVDSDTLKYFEMQAHFRPTALRVKYAYVRLYEGDEAKAEAIYTQFLKVCDNYHIPGEVQTEKKLVEYVRNLPLSVSN